jgi:hypothetical protein
VRQNHEHIWGRAASELWDAAPTWIVVVDALGWDQMWYPSRLGGLFEVSLFPRVYLLFKKKNMHMKTTPSHSTTCEVDLLSVSNSNLIRSRRVKLTCYHGHTGGRTSSGSAESPNLVLSN